MTHQTPTPAQIAELRAAIERLINGGYSEQIRTENALALAGWCELIGIPLLDRLESLEIKSKGGRATDWNTIQSLKDERGILRAKVSELEATIHGPCCKHSAGQCVHGHNPLVSSHRCQSCVVGENQTLRAIIDCGCLGGRTPDGQTSQNFYRPCQACAPLREKVNL